MLIVTADQIPAVGQTAPDFTLNSTAGKPVTLSSFKGEKNVLVAFFPFAFTSTCTAELCAFSEDFEQFIGKTVEVLPISVDAVPSLKEYKKKFSMNVELLSDFKREASAAYGVLRDNFASARAYFLIDKSGVVRWSFVEEVLGTRRTNEELFSKIAELDK